MNHRVPLLEMKCFVLYYEYIYEYIFQYTLIYQDTKMLGNLGKHSNLVSLDTNFSLELNGWRLGCTVLNILQQIITALWELIPYAIILSLIDFQSFPKRFTICKCGTNIQRIFKKYIEEMLPFEKLHFVIQNGVEILYVFS
jgi:hypothetical protein